MAYYRQSKYLGMRFGDWKVVDSFIKNHYKKAYNGGKIRTHSAVSYDLINQKDRTHIVLSGNTLRRICNGERSIDQIMNPDIKRCPKNKALQSYIKALAN